MSMIDMAQRSRALKRIQQDWDALGRSDPLWAVLTEEGKRGGKWDLDAFFATGREEIARVLGEMAVLGVLPGMGRALDFGCGVGRLTQALAERFAEADGVDVAPSMIERARALNRHGGRCRYHLNPTTDLRLFADASFDFIYSAITLQHIGPPLVQGYLREMARVLAPGGVLLFQLPSHRAHDSFARRVARAVMPGPLRRLVGRLRHGAAGRMAMHGVARPEVERLLIEEGCRVAAVTPDGSAGESWVSYRYCAVKEGT